MLLDASDSRHCDALVIAAAALDLSIDLAHLSEWVLLGSWFGQLRVREGRMARLERSLIFPHGGIEISAKRRNCARKRDCPPGLWLLPEEFESQKLYCECFLFQP
jgi:hypothetical protein